MNTNKIQELFSELTMSIDGDIKAEALKIDQLDRLVLLYKDEKLLPHLLIEAIEGYTVLNELNGIGITNKKYYLENIKATNFYEYSCKHEKFLVIFFPFILDILTKLIEGNDILKSHDTGIKVWKYCFENPESAFLSVEKETGLLGELILLNTLLDHIMDAVESWKGPEGNIDFHLDKILIEIKSTLKNFHTHTINGLDQLDNKEGYFLYLCSNIFQLTEKEAYRNINLCGVFSEIEEKLVNDPLQQSHLLRKLKMLNLTPEILRIHNFRFYQILDTSFFIIDKNFPVLTKESLKTPLNSRISKVRYDVDLDGLSSISLNDFIDRNL